MKNHTAALIARLDTSKDSEAERIISKLVQIGRPAVTELIQAASDLTYPRIRKWSLEALGAIGDQRAAHLLIRALKDERMTVKLHATRGLAKMRYKPAASAIRKLLNDPSGGIRVNAIFALLRLKDQSSRVALIKSLSDKQWYVRQHAARACGELRIKSSIPVLKKLMKRENRKAVLNEAETALLKLVSKT